MLTKGYSQVKDVDFKETYAPVTSMVSIRILIAIANKENMALFQFDVKIAFLHGNLDEIPYMEVPQGVEAKPGMVCKLNRSLYGLKQAPRQWHKKFHTNEFGLEQSKVDQCLYFNNDKSIILTIYVDDGLLATSKESLARELIDYLRENLEITMSECVCYLGIKIDRDMKAQTTTLTQQMYVEKLLKRFGMDGCNPVSTPEEVGPLNLTNAKELDEGAPFKELVGGLLYLVTCTRPDLAHSVGIASRTNKPTDVHWSLLKRILRYLKGTMKLGERTLGH